MIEHGVDDWINRRANVAQPEASVDYVIGDMAVRTCGEEDVEDEKRRPAEHKREKDDSQDFARFLLSHYRVQGQRLPLVSVGQEPGRRIKIG